MTMKDFETQKKRDGESDDFFVTTMDMAPLRTVILGNTVSLFKSRDGEAPLGFYYLLDEKGEPVPTRDRMAAEKLLRNYKARKVACTEITYRGHHARISTMFCVFNTGIDPNDPVLFETMIFSSDKVIDRDQRRHGSRVEAIAHHHALVKLVCLYLHRRKVSTKRAMIFQRKQRSR